MFVLDSFSLTFFSRHDDNQNVCGYDYKIYTLFLMISIPRNEFFLSFFLLKKMNKYQITVLRSKFSWTAKIDFTLPMSQMAVTIFFKKMCKVITALKGNRTVSDVNGKEWQYLNFLSSFFFSLSFKIQGCVESLSTRPATQNQYSKVRTLKYWFCARPITFLHLLVDINLFLFLCWF